MRIANQRTYIRSFWLALVAIAVCYPSVRQSGLIKDKRFGVMFGGVL